MPVRITIRNSRGAPWFSTTGSNLHKIAIEACMCNTRMTETAKILLQKLCNDAVIPGIEYIEIDNKLKLVYKSQNHKITICLEYPTRRATANSFNQLAKYLRKDENCNDEVKNVVVFKLKSEIESSIDRIILARIALINCGIEDPAYSTVTAIADYLTRTGEIPAELNLIR